MVAGCLFLYSICHCACEMSGGNDGCILDYSVLAVDDDGAPNPPETTLALASARAVFGRFQAASVVILLEGI